MRPILRRGAKAVVFGGVCAFVLVSVGMGQEAAKGEEGSRLRHRWFFSFGLSRSRQGVDRIKSLVDTAAEHGLDGMVLGSFGVDGITDWKEKDVALLKEVADHCAAKRIELIPMGFSVGYGGSALRHDHNFAAALPVSLDLVARGGEVVAATGENLLKNGDLEEHQNGRFAGYGLQDKPGTITFPDTTAASGKTAIRFENFGTDKHGHGRIMQKVAVEPHRSYRFSFRIKTRDLKPVARIQAMALSGKRTLARCRPKPKPTQDWTEVSLEFVNYEEKEVNLYAGIWRGKSGTFWLDDLRFEEDNRLTGIVRREGTPLTLRSAERDVTFVEDRDFGEVVYTRESAGAPLPSGSAIRDGEKLVLSCYKAPCIAHSWGRQVSLCMSNPDLYAFWEAQARRLHEVIGYKRFLLSMDEIRNGGGCLSCRNSGLSMAEIFGNCVTRQFEMFRKIDPGIEVLIWSDMLDPAHNARNNYYNTVGDFRGAWKHVPKDLTIMCWHHKIRDKSLGFFSQHGFRTFGASYYDTGDLSNPREWLVSLEKTPKAEGIMYTTWGKDYKLLADFGDMVSKTGAQK